MSLLLGFFDKLGNIRKTLAFTDLFRNYCDVVRQNSNIELSFPAQKEMDWENLEIQFCHVSFSYPNHDQKVLDDLNFTVKSGERVAIVGLNGSGKTTIVKLLLRLYDPTSGCITANGVDIREIPHGEYVKHFGVVLQDFCIFAYSVKENVVFDGTFNEALFRYALDASGLSGKISGLERGTETALYKTLDDDGVEFSGGEGQRLGVARAIYKNASFMIMDEPSSKLDPLSEAELFEKMSEISRGKSTFLISHRLSCTLFCDRIFVISHGKLAECGTHDSLMKADGIYADLFRSQAKFYETEAEKA